MPTEKLTRQKWQMFALTFTALFLEMMVIRWVPSVVHLVAYYANLMLLSSFLGLGVGAMAADRRRELFKWFPVFLACEIATLVLCRGGVLGATASEARFNSLSPAVFNAGILIGIFISNALVFVPLGQRMGILFNSMPRLSAYSWDLAGSLCGTLCFGLFSLRFFSPLTGMACVMAIFLAMSAPRRWVLDIPIFLAVLATMFATGERSAIWSPYYYITMSRVETPHVEETEPPPDLLTMRDPPVYGVKVNQFGYHWDAALDPSRYIPGTRRAQFMTDLTQQYLAPYWICKGRDRVLIVGAGGGSDVQAALRSGVKSIDAVEIDPAVIQLSRRFNAGAPYFNPRVHVQVDDARSFVAKATPGYDLVVFGFLDSQALFSSMSNARLDGYVYTVESMRSAYGLLNDHGMLSLSFFVTKDWLAPKLYKMVAKATGREPLMYFADHQMILCVPKDRTLIAPATLYQFHRAVFDKLGAIDLPTDDWPFLYLSRKTIPYDYLVSIASLLALSIIAGVALRGTSLRLGDMHFALLGMGFLLLETKSISDCTLFFGATWFVTTAVVAGVLLMVMAANLVAMRISAPSFWMYAPLFAILLLLFVIPRENILELGFAGRLLWTLAMVPLPVFFAGIIFSTTFRVAASPSASLGANLIGAMIGGFCEYLGMAIGSHQLSVLVAVAYLGSLLVLYHSRRSGHGI
jgi:hypothetical protein